MNILVKLEHLIEYQNTEQYDLGWTLYFKI